MRSIAWMCAVAAVSGPLAAHAAEATWTGATLQSRVLTVYSDGVAQVEETRAGDLPQGKLDLRITDVAGGLVAESVALRGDQVAVREVSVPPAQPDPRLLLTAAIGKTVRAVRVDPRTGEDHVETATLLAVEPQSVLRIGDRLEFNYPGRIVLPVTPDMVLDGTARLDFSLDSAKAGKRSLILQYLLPGLRWQADYVARYDEATQKLSLDGWISVLNGSEDDFSKVALRVVSGTVAREAGPVAPVAMRAMAKAESADIAKPQAVSGYHLYPVAKSFSIVSGERRQIAFVSRDGVPVTRTYRVADPVAVFRSAPAMWPRRGALLRLSFENAAEVPLPAGVMRVLASRSGDADVFLGEDRIGHTSPDGNVEVLLGRAVEVAYEAKRTDYREISRTVNEQSYEITLINDGEAAAAVEMTQTFPGQWAISGDTAGFSQRDAQTALWKLTVPPHGRSVVKFSVRVTMPG